MLEHQLASLPPRQADEDEAAERQDHAPWQDGAVGVEETQAPIGADRGEKHHGRHRMGPAFGTAPYALGGEKLRRADERGERAHRESPAAGPKPDARKERIGGEPPEDVGAQGPHDQRDREGDQHRVDRVTRQRDFGAKIGILGFVVLGHSRATPMPAAGCALVLGLSIAGCTGEFSTLQPDGPAAARVADLWWVMFAGAMFILAGVTAAALYAFKRERRGRDLSDRSMLVGWGLVFPLAILTALMGWAFLRGEQLLARPDQGVLTIRVNAVQWAWHASYPGGEQTVNSIHVPVGATFHVEVTSTDVIHSFWVPRLGGKIDAIPGKVNRIALRADRPGLYRGLCAEYCGLGHAHMLLELHAHPAEIYAAALAQAAGEPPPEDMPDVLIERRPPAEAVIRGWTEYLLEWVGLR